MFRVLGPPGPPHEKNENFCIWGHGYQNWVKRVLWVYFWRNFWKIFKYKGFGPKFWDTQYKIFFCFNQKNLFTNPSWNKFFLGFWDPLGPGAPLHTKWNFCIWGHGYQNSVKRVCWVYFWRNFWKIFKNEGFGPKFWDTQYKNFFFALIKKIFLQTLGEIIFRYHKIFF